MKQNLEQNVNLSKVESIIGYQFKDKDLLRTAFTHPSYSNEHKNSNDYQRLEFLGDSILNYIVGARLYNIFPNAKEGELSKRRAALVSAETLSKFIDEYGLIQYLRTGSGQSFADVSSSENVKCDLYEAIIGAISLDNDGALNDVKRFVFDKLEPLLLIPCIDYKSKFLEHCAKLHLNYKMETLEIPSDTVFKKFKCTILINKNIVTEGIGKNKFLAERNACTEYYNKFLIKKSN